MQKERCLTYNMQLPLWSLKVFYSSYSTNALIIFIINIVVL